MTKLRNHLRADDGIAMVVAIILLGVMLAMGLGSMNLIDNQSKQTAQQRQRETSFNVAEAALNAQITQISHHWAGSANEAFTTCTHATTAGTSWCPGSDELTKLVPGADANVAITWQTRVIDNAAPNLVSYYADSLATGTICACDANGDRKVWVRAEATVRGKTRVIVSLVQEQLQAESVPHAAILAGALTIANNGQHSVPIIDSNGGSIQVRCTDPSDPDNSGSSGGGSTLVETADSPCLGQPLGRAPTQDVDDWTALLTNQISGFSTREDQYPEPTVLSQDQVKRFIDTAQAEGTLYTSCPSSLAGDVVVINTVGTCSYTGSSVWNTQDEPGFVLFLNAQSKLVLGGTTVYNGVIYHANMGVPPNLLSTPQSSDSLITTSGNTLINGGVIIDGPGRMYAGESGMNIRFDDHAYEDITSLAAAGIVQNSWREIQAGA